MSHKAAPTNDASSAKFDDLTTGLTGLLPSGLTYSLGGSFTHTRGTEPGDTTPDFDEHVADASIQLEQPLLRNFWTDAARTEIQVRKREVQISEMAVETEVRLVVLGAQILEAGGARPAHEPPPCPVARDQAAGQADEQQDAPAIVGRRLRSQCGRVSHSSQNRTSTREANAIIISHFAAVRQPAWLVTRPAPR